MVAIKEVSSQKLTSQKLVDNLDQEILILKSINHPKVVNLYDVLVKKKKRIFLLFCFFVNLKCSRFEKKLQKTKDKTFLVMEYCKGGDFSHYLKKKKHLNESQARYFLQQLGKFFSFFFPLLFSEPQNEEHALHALLLEQKWYRCLINAVAACCCSFPASALEFMRLRKLIHRDLKPSNILMATVDDQPQIKVADFGYARYIEPQDLAETACGTPLYMVRFSCSSFFFFLF